FRKPIPTSFSTRMPPQRRVETMSTSNRLAALLILVVAPGVAAAQVEKGRVVGRVVDAAQGSPIAGALIELVGLPVPRRGTTGVDGRYSFADIPAGEVGIRVRMIGYGPKLVTGVTIIAGAATTQNISLNP